MTRVRAVGIVGAGWLGGALARVLSPPVVATTRSGRWPHGDPPPGAELHALALCAPRLELGPLGEASALVISIAPGRSQDRRALYVDGTRRLLETRTSTGHPLRRVVFVGSTSALPDVDGWVDESCEIWPQHERGRVQREAEAVVQACCEAAEVPWLVLRMGGLYGPGRELARIYASDAPRRRGLGPDGALPGHGAEPTNLIHRDDAVAALQAALRLPAEIGGVVHVVDDDHTPRREMYARIATARGLEPVRWAEPPPPDGERTGKKVRNDALKQVLGVRLSHPTHS
mgnify:CR=1 FL=1